MYESVTIVAGDIVQKAPKLLNNDTLSWNDWFELHTQENGYRFYMSYENYLKTPSAAGRQLNKRW